MPENWMIQKEVIELTNFTREEFEREIANILEDFSHVQNVKLVGNQRDGGTTTATVKARVQFNGSLMKNPVIEDVERDDEGNVLCPDCDTPLEGDKYHYECPNCGEEFSARIRVGGN